MLGCQSINNSFGYKKRCCDVVSGKFIVTTNVPHLNDKEIASSKSLCKKHCYLFRKKLNYKAYRFFWLANLELIRTYLFSIGITLKQIDIGKKEIRKVEHLEFLATLKLKSIKKKSIFMASKPIILKRGK